MAKLTTIIFMLLASSPVLAVVSFGTAVNTGTAGVSVQAQPSRSTALHATYLFVGRRPAITADYQLFSERLGGTRTRGYLGGGAEVALSDEDKDDEVVSLRVPVGAQYDFLSHNVQIFSEIAGAFGPLPAADGAAQFTLGARAWF